MAWLELQPLSPEDMVALKTGSAAKLMFPASKLAPFMDVGYRYVRLYGAISYQRGLTLLRNTDGTSNTSVTGTPTQEPDPGSSSVQIRPRNFIPSPFYLPHHTRG